VHQHFSRILGEEQLNEIQPAAIFLTAAIMDCLGDLIAWTEQTSMTFCKSEANSQFPEIERSLNLKDLENGK
jgi:hypothetical protein